MKIRLICALVALTFSFGAHAQSFKTLISVKEIQHSTDEFFVDDTIKITMKENGNEVFNINYSYSKIGPTPACGLKTPCTPSSGSVITFDLDGGGLDKPINIPYMCTSIGVYSSYHNEMRDLHCGPSYKLVWNGSEYELDK